MPGIRRDILRRWFVAAILCDLALLGAIIWCVFFYRDPLVKVRQAFITRPLADRRILELAPAQLAAYGFRFDPAELIRGGAAQLGDDSDIVRGAQQLVDEPDPVEKAIGLVRLFSRNGGEGAPDNFTLAQKVRFLVQGQGLCSDHAEVFIALARLAKLEAREVLTNAHNTCEFYVPELGKWVWVDPEFALLARQNGRYLSLFELRDAYFSQTPVELTCVGTPAGLFSLQDPRTRIAYEQASAFADAAVVWGNNVFEYDQYRRQLLWLPKIVRQIPLIIRGILPKVVLLSDARTQSVWSLRLLRYGCSILAVLLAFGTLGYPIALLVRRFRRPRQSLVIAQASAPLKDVPPAPNARAPNRSRQAVR